MAFVTLPAPTADEVMDELERKDDKKYRKAGKTLGLLAQDPKYPGLHSHKREAETGPNGEDIWESYVENKTPSAWRVFWYYGPDHGTITVFSITPHP